MTVVFDVAALAERADNRQFYLRHVEYTPLVLAVEGGGPAEPGKALVSHFSHDPTSDALMFKEDPQTQNIVTIDRGLCVTDDNHGRMTDLCHL